MFMLLWQTYKMASNCDNSVLSKCRSCFIGYLLVSITLWVTLYLIIVSLPTIPDKVNGLSYTVNGLPEQIHGQPEKANGLKDVVRDVWTPVTGLDGMHVYNAHFTGRDRHVRIVGVGPTDFNTTVQCTFLCLADIAPKETGVSGKVIQMMDGHRLRYNNIEILCKLPPNCNSDVVAVSGPGSRPNVYLKIYFPPIPRVQTSLFTVCFPVISPNFSLFTDIVQSFEIDSLLGADRFTIYYISATPEVDAVLRMYVDSGRLNLYKWNIPKLEVHYFAKGTSIRDCFYRNMHTSKYLVFKDFDEVLLPYNHHNWNSLLNELLKKDPKYAAFTFKNSFLYKNDPDVSAEMLAKIFSAARAFGLTVLLKQHRQTKVWPGKLRSKFIVNPEGADNVETHTIGALRRGYKDVVINETDALLYHYTENVNRTIPRRKDSTMLRFKDKLVKRVDNVYVHLHKYYTVWKPLFT